MKPNDKVGKFFTWGELVRSADLPFLTQAQILGIRSLVWFILDPLREKIGQPIFVTSGYRNHAMNRRVGGADASQHLNGEAADIISPGMSSQQIAEAAREFRPYKIITYRERSHVHVSIPSFDLTHHPNPLEELGK
jgi:hypothetical protein